MPLSSRDGEWQAVVADYERKGYEPIELPGGVAVWKARSGAYLIWKDDGQYGYNCPTYHGQNPNVCTKYRREDGVRLGTETFKHGFGQ